MLGHTGLERAHKMALGYAAELGDRPRFNADAGRGSLYIYEQIGLDWWTGEGLTAKTVQQALEAMKGASGLDIFINSPGGDIFEAKAIYAQLRRFSGEKVVHVDGIAASAASFIAMAGDKIITAPSATWMIHEVWTRVLGRATDMRAMADVLDLENRIFAEAYSSRSKSKLEDVSAWMNAETWMNAATAKERGFTDEISEQTAVSAELATALSNAVTTLRAGRG